MSDSNGHSMTDYHNSDTNTHSYMSQSIIWTHVSCKVQHRGGLRTWSSRGECLLSLSRSLNFLSGKKTSPPKQSQDDHRVLGEYTQYSLVEPLSSINRCFRRCHDSDYSPHRVSLSPHSLQIRKEGWSLGKKWIGGSEIFVHCLISPPRTP